MSHTHSRSVCGIYHPLLPELIPNVISTVHRKLRNQALLRMQYSRGCTSIGLTSVSHYWSILLSKIHPSLALKFSKSMGTGSDTPITPSNRWNKLGNNRFSGMESDCSNPPPGWPIQPQKSPRTPSSRWTGQAPCPPTQNLWNQISPSQVGKIHPPGHRPVHPGPGSLHPQPKNTAHF